MERIRANWAAAFVAYSKGTDVEEIAHSFSIPVARLKQKMSSENWVKLRGATDKDVAVVTMDDRRLARIQEHREKNFEIAIQLQKDILKCVTDLNEDKLRIERPTKTGGVIEVRPSMADRLSLVSYIKGVQEIGYRALGDVVAPAEGNAIPGAAGQPMAITINLPGAISEPRQARGYQADGGEILPEPAKIVGPGHLTIDIPAEAADTE